MRVKRFSHFRSHWPWPLNLQFSYTQDWASECSDVENYKWRLNPVWHRMLYSCTHTTAVGVKGFRFAAVTRVALLGWSQPHNSSPVEISAKCIPAVENNKRRKYLWNSPFWPFGEWLKCVFRSPIVSVSASGDSQTDGQHNYCLKLRRQATTYRAEMTMFWRQVKRSIAVSGRLIDIWAV